MIETKLKDNPLFKPERKSPPIWFMRQAGRYQKSYQVFRKKYSFENLYRTPDLAYELTKNAVTEFDFDAGIIFSDILVIPHALGQNVSFTPKGPLLDYALKDKDLLPFKETNINKQIDFMYQAIKLAKEGYFKKVPLFGFSGAPFTLSHYMINGSSFEKINHTLPYYARDPKRYKELIDILSQHVLVHVERQIKAGADIIQIFDSSLNNCPNNLFYEIILPNLNSLFYEIKKSYPKIPLAFYCSNTIRFKKDLYETSIDILSCDHTINLKEEIQTLTSKNSPILQGNFPQQYLLMSPNHFPNFTKEWVKNYLPKGNSFIFNLAHGVLPQTPEENVKTLIKIIRENYEKSK